MPFALETIDYQLKDKFPQALTALIEAIFKDTGKGKWTSNRTICTSHPAAKEIEKLVFSRLGLNVVFNNDFYIFTPAAIIPFFRDRQVSNSSLQGFMDLFTSEEIASVNQTLKNLMKERQKTLRKIHNKTGFVNTKLAKVGGYLSEVRHFLIIDFVKFKRAKFTAEELCAIVLHELGHAFDGLEEHYRTDTTNRAILDILVDLHHNKTDKAIYRYRNTFTRHEYDRAQLSNNQERQDFCGELAKHITTQVDSQLQNGKYDQTNFENMADTFAARFGMAEHLSSALLKLYKGSGRVQDNSATIRATMVTVDLLTMACVFLLLPVYGFIIYTVMVSYLLRISASQMTYDEPLIRLRRIRNTMVNAIKDERMSGEVVKDVLAQIEFIEAALANNSQYKSLLEDVGDWLYSDAREDRHYIDLQQMIENQLNNRLYIQSAQLRLES